MNAVVQAPRPQKILARMAERFGIDGDRMLATLKATAFKGDVSNEQMIALLVVAEQYGLNPWTREIYAFPDRNQGVVPVVGVDGWSRIINSSPQFDGMEFNEPELRANSTVPEWIECVIFRKDRAHPIKVREYFKEVAREVGPWKSHPRRMLRHKAMIQCARLAFGFVGIFDEDEAERIKEAEIGRIDPRPDTTHIPPEEIEKHFKALREILDNEEDKYADEFAQADALRAYHEIFMNPFPEVYSATLDKLAKEKIISKAKFRQFLELRKPEQQDLPT